MKFSLARLLGILVALAPPVLNSQPSTLNSLATPAAPDSQCSNLTAAPDGTLFLTWCGPGDRDGERALRFATLAPAATDWSTPRTIISTSLLMENWADFASLVVGTDHALTAQWFQKSTPEAHGYDGWLARSTDGGYTWTKPARLGHEFVALAPLSAGRTLAVWLESMRVRTPDTALPAKRDPHAPRSARAPGAPYVPSMKLLARLLGPEGSTLGEWTVDPDVCSCCQNSVTALPGDRVFVTYRGHTADEIRDNLFALFDDGKWSQPQTLKDDLWKIAACPVNGPAVDAHGDALAVAWFTVANGVPRVQARYSSDGGRALGAAIPIDLGKPLGRIETVMLADRSALILWMEVGTAENSAGIYARRLWPEGQVSAPQLIADSTQARASGFPRAAARPNGHVVMSWTQAGEPNHVRTLAFDPSTLTRSKLSGLSTPNSQLSTLRPSTRLLEFCVAPIRDPHHPDSQ
jgi:hypothetical protein